MFTKLGLRNFKAWRGTHEARLRPITLVLGVNSAGKTSLLQPLLLLQQTAASPDRRSALDLGGQPGARLHFGTMIDVLSGHDPSQTLAFELGFVPTVQAGRGVDAGAGVGVEAGNGAGGGAAGEVERAGQDESLFRAAYGATEDGGAVVLCAGFTTKGKTYEVERVTDEAYALTAPPLSGGAPAVVSPDFAPERSIAFSPEALAALGAEGAVVRDAALALRNELSAVAYLGPLREFPARSHAWQGHAPERLGSKGEFAVQALLAEALLMGAEGGASAEQAVRGEGEVLRSALLEQVSRWLVVMGVADGLELVPQGASGSYAVVVVRGKERANLADVGFGVSQVLPILVLAHVVPRGATILLEQPEIHLHPLAQSALANLLVEVSLSRGVQFLVETHSEHLFRRLQSLLAEAAIQPDQCALHVVTHDGEGAALHPLEVDAYGRVTRWPARLFGDAVGEAERQLRWMVRRKQEERGRG
ncbi:AAA family ATPase [Chondromyces crocatus]|uniref:ATPase AAA-type core domain-containing protein n=1 Tax=Chondromyces crocatus TaxID=52 RepID=A0A0K1EDM5_CHOCO|nr:DUF3696 domain-containing protein [Chondromyces crocatus]AKT38976.1 uncharacterized protein CMC5_031230 [Chondromyces crocatus]